MKKFLSTLLSAAMTVSAIACVPCSAAEKITAASDKSGMVIFGDSIATGYTMKGNVAHNYGEICGDYLGCKVSNYAVVGDTTDDMLGRIDKLSAEQKKNISDAEYVVISIGGNDIMQYIAKALVDFALSKTDNNFFNEGYTAADIPKNPTMSTLTKVLNINSILSYANSGIRAQIELSTLFGNIGSNLSFKNKTYEGYIETHIIPNIETAADKIKAVNPDAKIMVQTIYQPIQFEPTYIEKTYGKKSNNATFISLLRSQMETVMGSYSDQINAVDGIDVVDVKAEFTAYEGDLSTDTPGNANYFVDVQTGGLSTMDVHPNQKGHLAIAAAILNKIGKLHVDDGLLTEVYNGISDKDKYPAIAYATYKKVAGEKPTPTTTTTSKTTTTTTTTSTTTKKPTTTTTTSKTTTTTSKPTTTTTTSKTTTTTTTSKTTTTTKKTTTSTTTTKPVTTTTTTQPANIKLGDINNDGFVDSVDASGILAEYARLSSNNAKGKFSETQQKAADVDKNGLIDSVDASRVLAYYAYISNTTDAKSIEEFIKTRKK